MTLEEELADHIEAVRGTVAGSSAAIVEIVTLLCSCFEEGGKLLLCGNGGSAADSQHLAAEFVNRLRVDRRPLAAIALTTDTSALTCIGNDASFADVFARQVEALGRPGDVLFAFSTGGGSVNVLAALKAARRRELVTVGFTGAMGGARMSADCDVLVVVPSRDTARIQECHEFIYHVIAGRVENWLLDSSAGEPTVTVPDMERHHVD
jgi:D-sedoheptulose 7-phosphate isomerase